MNIKNVFVLLILVSVFSLNASTDTCANSTYGKSVIAIFDDSDLSQDLLHYYNLDYQSYETQYQLRYTPNLYIYEYLCEMTDLASIEGWTEDPIEFITITRTMGGDTGPIFDKIYSFASRSIPDERKAISLKGHLLFKSKFGDSTSLHLINGKVHYELLPDGHPDLPLLLTEEEFIFEQGLALAFMKFELPNKIAVDALTWYEYNVYKLVKEGLINGYSEEGMIKMLIRGAATEPVREYPKTTQAFYGENNITLAELLTILARIELPKVNEYTNQFPNLDNEKWYYDAYIKAYETGVLDGFPLNNLEPDDHLSREQAAYLLYNSLNKSEVEKKLEFTDIEEIGQNYLEAIEFLFENEIINGFEDNSFRPKNFITRGEIATMLLKCSKEYSDLFAGLTPHRKFAENFVKEYYEMDEKDRPRFFSIFSKYSLGM